MSNKKVNILIVDDKEANLFVLEQILSTEDRNLIRATTGKEALTLVLNKEIDLIILDVQMPEIDGFEVAQLLKSNVRTKDIPIIFASAEKTEHESMMKGFEEGAIDYLHKPLNKEVTEAKVAVHLKMHIQKKELIEKNIALKKAEEEIHQLNAELKKNVEELEFINNELESFSYSISHDLRAPLRAINGYTKIIDEEYGEKGDDEFRRLFGVVRNESSRMGILIDDLLAFSRLGRKSVQKSLVDMNQIVTAILKQNEGNIKPNTKIKVNKLQSAQGDYNLLFQVFVNLISNAIKYSFKKDEPEIEVGGYQDGNDSVYYVKDNGAGFDMNYVNNLFGVFHRLHQQEEFEGTGVGLAIVRRVILKHGGKVWAEGEVNKGAAFYFSLPG